METYIGTKVIKATPMTSDDAWRAGYRISGYDSDGYEVEYEDGYRSWSPKAAFDAAYRKCSAMTFGLAIEALRKGKKVCRQGWNGKGLSIELQTPDAHSKMTLPYLFMNYPSTPASDTAPANHLSARVPWLASQTDMLAEDWQIIE